ncbi:MAG: MBL fold metallo-hydrolase, partial [Deltaproteobacteria bacterium]|nr:MBL fold metallo-hydrolase [Deltaproteobacteria bacterium]
SGDLGRQNHFVMPPPVALTHADYLVVESTYGDHRHPAEDPHDTLKKIIQETVSKKGVVLIPAFAVGRSQALLFILSRLKREKAIPDIPVYLNSPMATEATHVFLNFFRETLLSREESQELTRVARFVTSIDESKMLNGLKGPAVVISASGMATGGRVLHHLKYLGPDPNNTIVFAGFQPPGTRGDALLKGAKTTKIHGEEVPIRARVELVDTLSSHADQEELMIWLKKFAKPPRMTFITHGELPAAEVLQEKIEKELGWNCTIPDHLEKFTL